MEGETLRGSAPNKRGSKTTAFRLPPYTVRLVVEDVVSGPSTQSLECLVYYLILVTRGLGTLARVNPKERI